MGGQDDIEAAYAIQYINVYQSLSRGATVKGHKVGLTSAAMQAQLGVDQPDRGVLLDHMVLKSGSALALRSLLSPRVEAEFAVVLSHDVDTAEQQSADDFENSIASVVLALEVIDTRYQDWQIGLWESVADNASSAYAVIGPGGVLDVADLSDAPIDLYFDGIKQASGTGADVLGNPLESVAWLARELAKSNLHLRAGDIVLTGGVHASVVLADKGVHVAARSPSLPDVEFWTR